MFNDHGVNSGVLIGEGNTVLRQDIVQSRPVRNVAMGRDFGPQSLGVLKVKGKHM